MDWMSAGKKILAEYTGEDAKKARLLLADCKKSGMTADAALDRIAKEIAADRPQDMRAAEDPAVDPVPRESRRGKRGKDKTKRVRRSDAAPPKPTKKEDLRQYWRDRAVASREKPEEQELPIVFDDIIPMQSASDETQTKIEKYAEEIPDIVNTYIDTILQGDTRRPSEWFPDLMYYIADRIDKPGYDIDVLDGLWIIYKRICGRCRINRTIENFSEMVSIHRGTFWDWMTGNLRGATPAYADRVKKWREDCFSAVDAKLATQDGTNANLMFTAKAVYGRTETAPVQRVEHIQTGAASYPVLGDISTDN